MAILDPSNQYGAFVNTNYVWDVQQLEEVDVTSPAFKELLIRLYQNINNIALVLNVKTTGQFPLSETVNGNLWFSDPNNTSQTALAPTQRQELQTTYFLVNVGASRTIPHNITMTAVTTLTDLNGAASDQVGKNYYGFKSAAGAANISAVANGTNIVITNNTGITFTTVYIVLKYLQD